MTATIAEADAFGQLVDSMRADGIPPDFEMRGVIFNSLKRHRPVFHQGGVKVSCRCGWSYNGPATGDSNQKRYHKHVATEIELKLTKWFHEQETSA